MSIRRVGPVFPQPIAYGGAVEWSEAWRKSDLDKYIVGGGLAWQFLDKRPTREAAKREGDFSLKDVEVAYEEATKTIGTAHDAYIKTVREFKTEIKNDLASISASAAKVQAESHKAVMAQKEVIELMTSERMALAIANAERLAAALAAINSIDNQNITFAVLGKKT
jgi:hypothetical protein